MIHRFLLAAAALCVLSAPALCFAQPAAAPPKQGEAPKAGEPQDFKSVYAKFQGLEDEMHKIAKVYEETAAAERPKLFEQYRKLATQASAMFPQLRKAALAEYKAKPNADKTVTETLMGILADHHRNDDYENGVEIATLLLDNKCDVKELPFYAGVALYCTNEFEKAKPYLEASKDLDRTGRVSQFLSSIDAVAADWKTEKAIRAKEAAAGDNPIVKMTTNKGVVEIELFENQAPQAVANFVSLVEKKFYDGLSFHRVLPSFMAQGGCPKGTGTGGPGYNIYCECEEADARKHFRGSLSMAHAGKNTGGSQFFLTFLPTTHLDGRHTVFGRVVKGFDVLGKLQRRDPSRPPLPEADKIVKAEVTRKRDHAYVPKKVQ